MQKVVRICSSICYFSFYNMLLGLTIFVRFQFIAILIGLCLHGAIRRTQPGLRAFQGCIYVMFNQNFYPPFYIGLSKIPEKLPLFYREYSNNSLTPLIFYLASVFAMVSTYLKKEKRLHHCDWNSHLCCDYVLQLPVNIIEPLSYSLVIYYLAGLQSSAYAVIMSGIVNILLYNVTSALGEYPIRRYL